MPYDLMSWMIETVFALHSEDGKTNESTDDESSQSCDTCRSIWDFFGRIFECRCCTCCRRSTNTDDKDNCLEKFSYWCCECDCGDDDLENKKLPHERKLILRKEHGQWYFGFMKLNMNRIGIYLLICGCIWCASIAFFEAIILSYTIVSNGDTTCPTPKYGSSASALDCFVFQNAWDLSPINKTSSIQCNSTTQLSFSGFQAACFVWIYSDVEATDVIEELGICAGIIAMLGTVVIILCYLCRRHRWRVLFDILVCLAVAGIPILLSKKGYIPFIAYILLGTLCGVIIITEYLLECVPLCTWLCLVIRACTSIKNYFKSKQTTVTPVNRKQHDSNGESQNYD
jgi:hypothetical protein